jgi:hypothetical protein
MQCHWINTIAEVFTALGTVGVAILAIWGDQVKDLFRGPRLTLSLVEPKGDLTHRNDEKRTYYFHVRVTNRRNAATGVRILLQGLSRRAASGQFVRLPLVYKAPMVWTPFEPGETERTVVDEEICDFGNLTEGDVFRPSLVRTPNNFQGTVGAGGCVRYEIVAAGTNVFSPRPTVFEVAWDGQFTINQEEMQRHLVVREVTSL